MIHSTPINSTVLTGKLDFPSTQGGPSTDVVVNSTYVIHFRELDLSAFLLFSSSLELTESDTSGSVALKVINLLLVFIF